ncbi:MAG: Smr/MutS family protein [Deltaproteobacteria bacterium]|nr:Smr/MutS family protein [Deltaproteobacteria bacterium]
MKKEENAFNTAFRELRKKLDDAHASGKKRDETPPEKKEKETVEMDAFAEAMSDVTPMKDRKNRIARTPGTHTWPAHPAPDDETEVMTHLYGLVRGAVDMDMTFSDEYMEGAVKGVSRKLMKKLKKGEFPVKDYIDLHGMTKKEAETTVSDFLIQSQKRGYRCVLIVHGRGLNSPDSFPVLKEGLPSWLGRGPVRKIVLAFATARPYDGGTGAVYVYLRKR